MISDLITGFAAVAEEVGAPELLVVFVELFVEVAIILVFLAAARNFSGDLKKSLLGFVWVAAFFTASTILHFMRELFNLPQLYLWERVFVTISFLTLVVSIFYLSRLVKNHSGEAAE